MANIVSTPELHRIVPSVAIYRDDGRFLIIKRASNLKVHPGKWSIPGGGMSSEEYTNTPVTYGDNGWYLPVHEALKREVREEVGLEIGEPKYLHHYTFVRPDGVPVLGMVFYAPHVSGDVVLDEDASDFTWILPEELSNYDCIASIHREIAAASELLK
ncbi:MAG: NUDIX domain-containing protein [Patescibacteria group bacterium]